MEATFRTLKDFKEIPMKDKTALINMSITEIAAEFKRTPEGDPRREEIIRRLHEKHENSILLAVSDKEKFHFLGQFIQLLSGLKLFSEEESRERILIEVHYASIDREIDVLRLKIKTMEREKANQKVAYP